MDDDDANVEATNQPALLSSTITSLEQMPLTPNVGRELAKAIINDMGLSVWTGYETFVDGCSEAEIKCLITWLWLWDITEGPAGQHTVEQRERKKLYHQPFQGVRSIPGKIVTQVRLGHNADLQDDDRLALERCLTEWAEEIRAEETSAAA